MGIEYTLVNHANKTLLELGRGSYYYLLDGEAFPTKVGTKHDATEAQIYDQLVSSVLSFPVHTKEDVEFVKHTAKKIHEFIYGCKTQDLEVVSDAGDEIAIDLQNKGYIYTSSIYPESDVRYLNSHVRINCKFSKDELLLILKALKESKLEEYDEFGQDLTRRIIYLQSKVK